MEEKNSNKYTFDEMIYLYYGDPKLSDLAANHYENDSKPLTQSELELIERYKNTIEENSYYDPCVILRFVSVYSEILPNIEDLSDPQIRKEKVDYCKQLVEKAYDEIGKVASLARLNLKLCFPESYIESVYDLLMAVRKSGLEYEYLIYRYERLIEAFGDTNYKECVNELFAYFQEEPSVRIASLVTKNLWNLYNKKVEENGPYLDDFIRSVAEECFIYLVNETKDYKILIEYATFVKLNFSLIEAYDLLEAAIEKNVPTAKLHLAATYVQCEYDDEENMYPDEIVEKMYDLISEVDEEEYNLYCEKVKFTVDEIKPDLIKVVRTIYSLYQMFKGNNNDDIARDFIINCKDVILIEGEDEGECKINPLLRFAIPNFVQILITADKNTIGLSKDLMYEILNKLLVNLDNITDEFFLFMFSSNYELGLEYISRKLLAIAYVNCISNPTNRTFVVIFDILWGIDNYLGSSCVPEFLSIDKVYNVNTASNMKNKKFLKGVEVNKITTLIYRIYAKYFVFEHASKHITESKEIELVTKELEEYISTLPKTRIKPIPMENDSINANYAHDLNFLLETGNFLSGLNSDENYEVKPAILAYETYYKLTKDEDHMGYVAGRLGELYDRVGNSEKSCHYLQAGIKKGDAYSHIYYSDKLFAENQTKSIALLEKFLKTNSSPNVQIKLSELLFCTESQVNKEKGRTILEKLSAKNYAHANHILGSMYYDGELFGFDLKKAIKHLSKAAKLGLFNAAYELVHMYAKKESITKKNIKDLITLLENNVINGSDLCKGLLAYIYTNGLGGKVAIEPEKSIAFLKSMKHEEFIDAILNGEWDDVDLIYEKLFSANPLENCDFLDNNDDGDFDIPF